MKRFILFFVFTLVAVFGFAAINQTGYVKTRGRLNSNGQVIPGKRLSAATVVLQNNSSVVSNHSGDFTLTLPANKYHLKNVKKEGYVVSDPDILSKQYAYSPNPLVLVLDEPSAQQDDKLASERKLRRNLQKQLQQREDELEALKGQNKITQEQYREALQKLYSDQESNEKFIAEMAERYSKIDFDQLDDFQRQVAAFIQNGELVRADSLLRTKGSMGEREAELIRLRQINDKERKELAKREENLAKSEKNATIMLADFAADCYNHFEICKLKLDYDSASYWLDKRAMMDTTNFNWQLEAGLYMFNFYNINRSYGWTIYLKFKNKQNSILNYFLRLEQLVGQQNIDSAIIETIYYNLAQLYFSSDKCDDALKYYQKVLDYEIEVCGIKHPQIPKVYYDISKSYYTLGNYYRAMEYAYKALERQKDIYGNNHIDVANSYSIIGDIYFSMGNYINALENKFRALDIQENDHPFDGWHTCSDLVKIYNSMGDYVKEQVYKDKEIFFIEKSLEVRKDKLHQLEAKATKSKLDSAPKFGLN